MEDKIEELEERVQKLEKSLNLLGIITGFFIGAFGVTFLFLIF